VIGASHAFTHRLWERFGPFQHDLVEEDQVNTLRAICAGGASTIDEPLVRYRRGGLSSRRFSAADYHSIERRRNARFLGVVKQWRIDARTAGCEREVEDSIHWQIEREMFIAALLRTELLRQRIDLVQSSATGTAAWRWKRLVDVSFPGRHPPEAVEGNSPGPSPPALTVRPLRSLPVNCAASLSLADSRHLLAARRDHSARVCRGANCSRRRNCRGFDHWSMMRRRQEGAAARRREEEADGPV
jgi:hypothetical protein